MLYLLLSQTHLLHRMLQIDINHTCVQHNLTCKVFYCIISSKSAGLAQLVERNFAKVKVVSSNLISRSNNMEIL